MYKKLRNIDKGAGRSHINLIMEETNEGYCGILTGGEKSHVGGVALVYPIQSKQGCEYEIEKISIPGHKDAIAAGTVAELISKAMCTPVVIMAGIHIDNASKEEIEEIIANCIAAADEYIIEMKRLNNF